MKYLKSFDCYNDELILEKLNIKSLINKFKYSSNKKSVTRLLVGTLLTALTVSQAINFVEKTPELESVEKSELIVAIKKSEKSILDKYRDPVTIKLSKDGWKHIREFEKLRLKAYSIGDGKITIGYGHAEPIKKSKYKKGDRITLEIANKLFIKDVNIAASGVRRMFSDWKEDGYEVKITQNQYDVLVSMAYNMGVGGLRRSEFVKKLKNKKHKEAGDMIKTTNISKKFPGLAVRRASESEKFKS